LLILDLAHNKDLIVVQDGAHNLEVIKKHKSNQIEKLPTFKEKVCQIILTLDNHLFIRTLNDAKFYKFQLGEEKSVKILEIDPQQAYGFKASYLQWFPKSKEFSIFNYNDRKLVFLNENLEKKERSDTYNQTAQELDEKFIDADGEGLSADGNYSVF